MRIQVGVGEQCGGVYYYKHESLGKSQGHLSSEVMSFLPSNPGLNPNRNKNDMCEICFRAKQTCGQFSVNQNKAERVFELIHCDI